jgi:hypothetical protein
MTILASIGYGKSIFFNNQLKKNLYNLASPKTEVAIGNNSLLFFIHASIKVHGANAHPNLHLIMPEFWLDKTHANYNNLEWEQTPRGLPWYVRREFYNLFPRHKQHQLISWGQLKTLRSHVTQELKNYATIYHGVPKIINNKENYTIVLPDNEFHVPKTTFFYNSWRSHNKNHGIMNLSENIHAHTELYQYSEKNIPAHICVIGSGRSIIWLANHFPNVTVHCIIQKHHKLPLFKNEKIPDNIEYYLLEDFPPYGKKYRIESKYGNNNYSSIIDTVTGNTLFRGRIFCALGMQHHPDITMNIDQENLLNYPYDALYSNWITTEETPPGSLTEATLRWAAATNNLYWAYEIYCYHDKPFQDFLTNQLNTAGIKVTPVFFDILKENILKIGENNIRQVPIHAPIQEEILGIYKKTYEQAYSLDNIDPAILIKLELALKRGKRERLKLYTQHEKELSDEEFSQEVENLFHPK